jgi:signal transduction histidine kinase
MEIALDFLRPCGADPARPALEHAERLLACFQTALGHELPNRLVALQGLARMLQMEEGIGAEARQLLESLAAQARRADELVRALAAVGRLRREARAGGPADPAEVVVEAAVEANLLSRSRPVEYHLAEPLPLLPVSRAGLHRALLELLSNAVRSGVAGRPLAVRLCARPAEGGVEFRVADNGRGLDEARASRLFEPFCPGQEGAGHGLGLFLVRQLVAEWGGALRVQSAPGQGTAVAVLVRSAAAPDS